MSPKSGSFRLKSDGFDADPILDDLREELFYAVGKPVMRMAGPELEGFLDFYVRRALLKAFSKAEALYINDMVKQANQSSRNMFEAVMAGAEVERLKRQAE